MPRSRFELLLPLAALLGGCGLRPDATRDWVAARVPAGASLLAEGPSGEALALHPGVRAVRSVALLAPVDVRGYDYVLLDSRIYGLDVRKRRPRALRYRAVARDPELEPIAVLEGRALRRAHRLLLLRRRIWLLAERAPVLLLQTAAGRSSASLRVAGRREFVRLRRLGAGSPPRLLVDGAPVAWAPDAEGARSTGVIELLRGEHRLELEGDGPIELDRLLASGGLRHRPDLDRRDGLIELLAARGAR